MRLPQNWLSIFLKKPQLSDWIVGSIAMPNKMNVLYLVWGENIINNGILHNQVFQFTKRLNQNPHLNVELLLGVPRFNYFLRGISSKQISSSIQSLKKVRTFQIKNILLPTKFYVNPILIPLLILPYIFFIKRKASLFQADILHCRSYPATLLAYCAKTILKLKFKIIFDTRGLYCEEAVMRKEFRQGGWSYKTWRKIETHLLNNVDSISVVSETFAEVIAQRTSNKNIHTITTSTNEELFFPLEKSKKKNLKEELGITSETLVYLGGLEPNGWYSLERIAFVYQAFLKIYPSAYLLIISQTKASMIIQKLTEINIDIQKVIIRPSTSSEDTMRLLNAGDMAIAAFQTNRTEVEKIIDYTVIASKTGEYLSVGLPLIYDSKMGAAAKLIDKYNLGTTFNDSSSSQELEKDIIEIGKNYSKYVDRCLEVAKSFSTAQHVKDYEIIYHANAKPSALNI